MILNNERPEETCRRLREPAFDPASFRTSPIVQAQAGGEEPDA